MAHESFEDAAVAAVMNRHFVNVKVDREERPDLDQIYQTAHQMLAQRSGGWPLTMFLPDGTLFFGGTYFPKEPRYGMPGFADLCERVAELWREKREEIAAQNAEVQSLRAHAAPRRRAPRRRPDWRAPRYAEAQLRRPVRRLRRRAEVPPSDRPRALPAQDQIEIAHKTLGRMCLGGIYDQLGGGFCRYSVDAKWMIPHFEKMLYDNGPLLGLLAHAWLATADPLYERCAAQTAGWIMREMQSPEGGYFFTRRR